MIEAEHEAIIKLARQAKLPRYMYDTPSARESLNRFAHLLALPSHMVMLAATERTATKEGK